MEQSGFLSAFDQLLKVVGILSKRVGEMTKPEFRQKSRNVNVAESGCLSREEIRGELRELYEQEKRQCSIILRGFQTEDVEGIRNEVRKIYLILNVDVVELDGLVKIGNTGLFRAKELHKDLRSALLSNAKNLRRIDQYESVYIQ